MSIPILATKLHTPQPPPRVVPRPHLIDRLEEGFHGGAKLTLVAAPAGFGKTTVVSRWIAGRDRPAAWLSLDEGDGDVARFLAYLVAALQTIAPHVGANLPALLQSAQPPPAEAMLTVLLNDLATVPREFILVLDDYHLIDARAVDHALTFLLEHLPPRLHLVISTREDPQLPLARLRARGQLTELRAADLRFTRSEAGGFFNQVMGLSLSGEDISLLEARTEGWVAGLKLAALSLRGRRDVSEFIRSFAGDHRYILDFLVEEVLQRQPAPVRHFLLHTSILNRLTGPLCDAVTGQTGGQAQLEALERDNLFIVPLTDRREWYRYHHLFAEVLSAHLAAEQPDQLATLHRRACAWYEQQGAAVDAIDHALAAREFARAAGLVEQALPTMRRSRQDATLLGWLQALPEDVIRARPVLGVGYAHLLLAGGMQEGVAERLQAAERGLEATAAAQGATGAPAGATIVVDEAAFRRLPGEIAIARAGLALAGGDVPGTMSHARRALDLAPPGDHLTRGAASGFLGLALWTQGDLEAAHRTYADGMASLREAGNMADAINGAITLASIRIAQGRLRHAMDTYERGLKLATPPGAPVIRGAADLHVGISELLLERNELSAAAEHLLQSGELGEHIGFPQNRYRRRVATARLRAAQGDLDGALDLLDEADGLYQPDFSPNVRPIAALKTRVWLAQGRLEAAMAWAQAQAVSAQDEVGYLREFEYVTLARLLLARHRVQRADPALPEAMGLLARLLAAAEAGERTGSVIELLVLQALAYQMQGRTPAALASVERALTLAEPEGYVRLFVDEGPPMATLLQEAARLGIAAGYARRLLAAFAQAGPGSADAGALAGGQLREPLSERELDVLRLLATDLSGPEVARELMVSLSTVRTHTRNIYSKLGVHSRRAAIRRAEALNLI